jgi:hypothetical protein
MEPATGRGSTGLPNVAYADDIEPQWSLPSIGGSIGHTPARMLEIAPAAMEPAVGRRKTRT